ncbi:hypothetical protein ACFL45_09580 [Candidatus Neomarinimicrobiota bacterium]
MDMIKRRICGENREFRIFSQEEADEAGYVGECLKAKVYTASRRPNLKGTLYNSTGLIHPGKRVNMMSVCFKGSEVLQ